MNKKILIALIIALIAITAGFMLWQARQQAPEQIQTPAITDTTDVIQADLNTVDIGSVDAEFKDIDDSIRLL